MYTTMMYWVWKGIHASPLPHGFVFTNLKVLAGTEVVHNPHTGVVTSWKVEKEIDQEYI